MRSRQQSWGRGNQSTRGRPGSSGGPSNRQAGSKPKPQCLICGKEGHIAKKCWYRYDEDDAEEPSANTVTHSNGGPTWYTDTGATDHITSELDKLAVRDRYTGGDQIQTASGSGMAIKHIGNAFIRSSDRSLLLNDVLHVPETQKNIISVQRLASDNNAFFEYHPSCFFIKDRDTKKVLLRGKAEGGLYPLPSDAVQPLVKQVHAAEKPSIDHWHNRLGHPSYPIINKVISLFNLPCSSKHY